MCLCEEGAAVWMCFFSHPLLLEGFLNPWADFLCQKLLFLMAKRGT